MQKEKKKKRRGGGWGEGGWNEGTREKQIEEVQPRRVRGGGRRAEIDNHELKATEWEDRKKKKDGGGDLLKRKNNGKRGNEATVVSEWHMRQCGSEGEERGTMTEAG